jgi:hypothetical protein
MIKLKRKEKITTFTILAMVTLTSSFIVSQWFLNNSSREPEPQSQTHYSLTISISNGGTTDPGSGVYSYPEGSTVIVSAIPEDGYTFDSWDLDAAVITMNPTNLVMDANHSLNALFVTIPSPPPEKQYLIISTTNGGTTDPTPEVYEHEEGATATVTALPAEGYLFDHWELVGHLRNENPVSVVMDKNHNLLAVFVADDTIHFPPPGSNIFGRVEDTTLKLNGEIIISGVGTFDFDPHQIVTKRPNIFQPEHFSVFDIIAHLNETGRIAMDYHFDEEMNTHVIDSINGKQNWWYQVHYDGGWLESNVFRMDHYPVKDQMYIRIFQTSSSEMNAIFEGFRNQIVRNRVDKKLIIPEVIISGREGTLTFKDVTVEAHNLRNDTFKVGIITAIDVILSLADQGKISYDLRWYSRIASSEVKNYYVDRINEDEAYGTCGFVYESGEKRFGFKNHIHLPSDIRVLNSPEYMEWFWICL